MDTPKSRYKCTNVAFAAYLEIHGHHVVNLDVQSQGKGIFWFDIETPVLNDLRVKWNGSPEAQFNDMLNRLKSLTY